MRGGAVLLSTIGLSSFYGIDASNGFSSTIDTVGFEIRTSPSESKVEIMKNSHIASWTAAGTGGIRFAQSNVDLQPIFNNYGLSFKNGANLVTDTAISMSAPGETRFALALAFSVSGVKNKQVLFDSGKGVQITLAPSGGVDPQIAQITFILPNNSPITVETCVGRLSLFMFTVFWEDVPGTKNRELKAAIYKDGQVVGAKGLPIKDFNETAQQTSRVTLGTDATGADPFNGKLSLAYVIKENVDLSTSAAYYQVFKKNQLAPVLGAENCGDKKKQPNEECDGSAGCTCACMSSCPPLNTSELSNKFHWSFPKGADDFFPTAEIPITCNDATVPVYGFESSGVAVCEGGAWSLPQVKCEVPCGSIDTYLSTYYSTRGVVPAGQSNVEIPKNATAGTHIACNEGYLSTDGRQYETLACKNGQWAQVTLDCKESCPMFEPRNAQAYKFSATKGSAPLDEFKHGESLSISCAPGASSNDASISSEKVTCIRGKWTTNTLICQPNCPTFPAIGHGYKFADPTIIAPSNQAGTTVEIRCDTAAGYYPTQSALPSNYTDSVTCREGVWTAQTLLCKRGCEKYSTLPSLNVKPPVMLVDDQTGAVVSRDENTVPYGSRVSITCEDGFAASNGRRSEALACVGAWPDLSLKCFPICPANPELPEGLVYLPDPPVAQAPSNATVLLEGNSTAPVVAAPAVDAAPVQPGQTEGSFRRIGCADGTSSISGRVEEIIYCNNGHWTQPTLKCEQNCPKDALTGVHIDNETVELITELGDDQFASLLQKKRMERVLNASLKRQRSHQKLAFLQMSSMRQSPTQNVTAEIHAAETEVKEAVSALTPQDKTTLNLPSNATAATIIRSLESIGARRQLRCKDGLVEPNTGRVSEYLTCVSSKWTIPQLRCEPQCPDFPDLGSAYVVSGDRSNYRGSSKRVMCAPGLSNNANNGIVSEEVSCGAGGQWGAISLDCRADCEAEDIPPHIATIAGYQSVAHGSKRTLVCAEFKDKPDAPLAYTTCNDGKWSPYELQCGGDCPVLDLKNGRFTVKDETYTLKFGSKVTLLCDADRFETLVEGAQTCMESGAWAGTFPQCQAKCGAFPSLGAAYQVTELTPGVKHVECAAGYVQDPPDASDGILATCSEGGSNPGVWNFKLDFLKCLPACSAYQPRVGEQIVSAPSAKNVNGDTLEVGCAYDLSIKANITCVAGVWSDSGLTCRKSCNALSFSSSLSEYVNEALSLKEGYALESNKFDGSIPTILTGVSLDGDSALLVCAEGYLSTSSKNSQEIRCSDGIVSRPTLRCQKSCPQSSPLQCAPGSGSCQYVTDGSSIRPGQTRKIYCADGYVSITSEAVEEIVCDSGVWSQPTIKCEKTCGAFSPLYGSNAEASPVKLESNGLQTVSVRCLAGFASPLGSSASEELLTCAHGVWQTQTLRCEANCRSAPVFDPSWNLQIFGGAKDVTPGSSVQITCKGASSLNDSKSSYASPFNMKSETLYCRNGSWTIPSLRCSDACLESDLVASLEAHVKTFPGLALPSAKVLSRLNAQVSCPPNTDAIRGSSPETLVCQNGVWSNVELECAPRCPALSNADLKLSFLSDAKVENYTVVKGDNVEATHGQSAVVTCKEGAIPAEGSETDSESILCLRGQWTKPALHCAPACPEIIDESKLIMGAGDKMRRHGAVRKLKCAAGTRAVQGALADTTTDQYQTLRCNNGAWEGNVLECRTNCRADMLHGAAIEDKCPSGTSSATGINAALRTCLDGKMTETSVDCLKNCPVFDPAVHAKGFELADDKQNMKATEQGAVVKIKCPSGYTARKSAVYFNGVQSLRCWDGEWTTPALECYQSCSSDPVVDANAVFTIADNKLFAAVQCKPGFVPQYVSASKQGEDVFALKCADGKWSPSIIRCTRAVVSISVASVRTLWTPQGDQPATLKGRLDSEFTVYRPDVVYNEAGLAFYPLGDYLVPSGQTPIEISSMAPLVAGNVLRPVSYQLIWKGEKKIPSSNIVNIKTLTPADLESYVSANGDAVSIWKPIAPLGFTCLGHVASRGFNAPSRDAIRCVSSKCVLRASGPNDGVALNTSASGFSAWKHGDSLFTAANAEGGEKSAVFVLDPKCVEVN
eukprot:GDKJ01035045.1.p1 GENE.GDKJ01035045.1~~GDKJ01035045.1.p1  ORF type:complete len:2098 (-),score=566.31 GDKJ01035045.1:286-6579(-)